MHLRVADPHRAACQYPIRLGHRLARCLKREASEPHGCVHVGRKPTHLVAILLDAVTDSECRRAVEHGRTPRARGSTTGLSATDAWAGPRSVIGVNVRSKRLFW